MDNNDNWSHQDTFDGDIQPLILNRINIMPLVRHIKRKAKHIMEPYIGMRNDPATRHHIAAHVSQFMDDLEDRGAFLSHYVVCNEENNPPSNIENNMLTVNIVFDPNPEHTIDVKFTLAGTAGTDGPDQFEEDFLRAMRGI